ncbi:MAG: cupredoxin domain-containing protein [Gammaproteobacteria bacterium]|nr:cupredoxin domain-containing protein [Gammaproteobacteria bacterium]MDH5651677.1 cupredoxin domain-containing protein [Gammaproteobacteria bacterium]
MKHTKHAVLITALTCLLPLSSQAIETFTINIKDHKFDPAEITIPANTKVKLLVQNNDATPEEFESYELHREKIIRGNSKAIIFVGPLEPGRYNFFGEFNPKTAQGFINVK